jgi:tetratricopeptide (TPR) repeat protein
MALIQRAEQTHSPADLAEANALFRQTLSLRPQHDWAHFGLGTIAKMQGDVATAQAEFQQEARIVPDYAPTYFELGMIAWSQKDIPQAQRMFERSRELDSQQPQGRNVPSKSAQTRLMLARIYTAAGRTDDAQRMEDEARLIKSQQ